MKTYKLNSEITLTEEQMKKIVEAYNAPEFEYPIFKKLKSTGDIVKFTELRNCSVVWEGTGERRIGYTSYDWASNISDDTWEDVPYDRERDLWHGQPILGFDNALTHRRAIMFYDAINKRSFSFYGNSFGYEYDNYEAIPSDRYDDWIIEAFKAL